MKPNTFLEREKINIYPIGAIYFSINNINPSTFFGGTWEQIKDKFLLACGSRSAGTTGGEETHTLTINEMPSHTHIQNAHTHTLSNHVHSFSATTSKEGAHFHGVWVDNQSGNTTDGRAIFLPTSFGTKAFSGYYRNTSTDGEHTHTINGTTGSSKGNTSLTTATNQNTGKGQAHNNMPPFLAVYIWKRIT